MTIEALRRVAEMTAKERPDEETRALLEELDTMAESLRSSERRDLMLCGVVMQARMTAAEIASRWNERDSVIELLHEAEALLPDYEIALAGRADDMGVKARLRGLSERLTK